MLHSRKHVNQILQTLDASLDKIEDSGTMTRGFSKHGGVGADYKGFNLGAGSSVHIAEIYLNTNNSELVFRALTNKQNGIWTELKRGGTIFDISEQVKHFFRDSDQSWLK